MKRIILLIAMIATFAAMGGTAQAVPTPGYCGGSATADRLVHHGPPSEWVYTYSANCGVDKWVRLDLQDSTVNNGGWTTQETIWAQTSTQDANHWVQHIVDHQNSGVSCSNSLWWSLKVSWGDGTDRTAAWKGNC